MSKFQTCLIAFGSFVFSILIFKNLVSSYQSEVADLRFGNVVSLAESPISYWLSMSITLFVASLLLYLAISLIRSLVKNET